MLAQGLRELCAQTFDHTSTFSGALSIRARYPCKPSPFAVLHAQSLKTSICRRSVYKLKCERNSIAQNSHEAQPCNPLHLAPPGGTPGGGLGGGTTKPATSGGKSNRPAPGLGPCGGRGGGTIGGGACAQGGGGAPTAPGPPNPMAMLKGEGPGGGAGGGTKPGNVGPTPGIPGPMGGGAMPGNP